MHTVRCVLTTAAVVFGLSCASARAEVVSSTELILNAKAYDGTVVAYRGEAVGEIMARGDFAWMNLNDGSNAIGVWLPKGMASGVMFGSYRARGDTLEVQGAFHRSCAQHGGDLDIHAESVTIVEHGKLTPHQLNPVVLKLSAVFLVALLVIAVRRR